MSDKFDWKKKLTDREKFITGVSLLVGLVVGMGAVAALSYALRVF